MKSKPTYQELENKIKELEKIKISKENNESIKLRLKQKTNEFEKQSSFINALLDNLKVGVVACDVDGKLTYFNKATQKFHGLPQEDIDSEHWAKYYDLYLPDGKTKMHTKDIPLFKALEGEQFNDIEMMIIPKQGKSYTLAASGSTIFDTNGKKQGAVVSMYDISERKEANKELAESEDKLSKTIIAANDGTWDWNLITDEVYFDPQYYKMAGYDVNEFPHNFQEFQKRIHPEDADYIFTQVQKHLEGETDQFQVEFRFHKKNGSWLWIMGRGLIVEQDVNNKPLRFIGTHRDITDLKQTEEALKASEEKFHTIADFASDWEYWTNPQGEFIHISQSCERITGYSQNEFNQNPELLTSIVHPDDVNNWKNHKHNVFDKAEIESIEFRIITKKGKERWIGHVCQTIYNDEGVNIGIRGSNRDITENKLVESALQESKQKFESMILNSPDLIMSQNTNAKLEYISPQCENILGYTAEEIKNIDLSKLIHPDDLEKTKNTELTTLGGVELNNFEYRFFKKNGDVVWLDHTARPIIIDGKITEILSTVRDISKRKLDAEKIKESEANLNSLINNRIESIWSIDENYNYLIFNDFFKEAYYSNYNIELKKGLNALNLLPPELQEFWKPKYDIALAGKKLVFEFSSQLNNELYFFEVTLNPIISNHNIIGVSALSIDITERKKAEEALLDSEKKLQESNKTKDKFFSIIAHDLRSPFNTMLGFTELLNEKYDDYSIEQKRRFIGIIYDGLQSTLKLLDNLLQWSLSQKGAIPFNPEKINLYLKAKETCNLLNQSAEKKSIKLINQLALNIYAEADGAMLATIIRNLLSNAIKYTHKSGEIIIKNFLVPDENNIQYIGISVSDTGVGIRKDIQSHLFDIGENTSTKGTENEKGTGLGLVLCKEFVEKHGGKIWIKSEINKGSTFYFTIPNNTN